jgi:hypothetical protein
MDPKLGESKAKAAKCAAGAGKHLPSNKSDPETPGQRRQRGYDPRAFGSNEWLEANLALESHYLSVSRPHIEEMCLDLQPLLSDQIRKALASRLRERAERAGPSEGDPAAAAVSAVADLAGDISWALSWEQTKQLVEPYAKGSWLLAQIQAHEEERLVAIYAAELTKQIAGYVQELILRAYGVAPPQVDETLNQSGR